MEERRRNWVAEQGGLPRYIERIVKHLKDEHGMTTSHAIAVAVNAAKKMCATGDLNWPGLQQVNPGSRAEACAAVAQWERMRAAAKAASAARRAERRDVPEVAEERTIDVDVQDLDTRGRTLHGYAALYGPLSEDLGGFRERVERGAFADVLNGGADVRCLLNHDANQVLGRTRSGTLRLFDEERGLRFECDLPESPLGDNVREAVKRRDIDGASFRFKVAPEGEKWEGEVRTITKVAALLDCSVATLPAYPSTSIELRTRPSNTNEEERTMPNGEGGGGLTVEDRTATPADEPNIEERVLESLRSVAKGEARSLTTTSAAPIAPPELSTYLFDKLRPASVLLSSGVRVISTDRDSIQWPKIATDLTPAWTSEGAAIPPSDPTFTTLTATPRKLAALVQFSNEVIDDSDPSVVDVMRRHVSTILALKLDIAAFEGSGVAPEIRGLKNVAGIQTISAGANGAALTNLDLIADAIAALEAVNANPGAIVMPPRTWGVIRKLKDTQNRPLVGDSVTTDARRSIFGIPVFVTSQLSITETQGTSNAASSIYVYDPSQVVVVRRQDAELELDRSRLFNSDQSEMRGKLRADVLAPNPQAIVRIVGVL